MPVFHFYGYICPYGVARPRILFCNINILIGFMSKSLRRSSNSMIAGVCGGVANYFDIDPTVVRILWVLFVLLGGSGILVYVIMWILMPR